MTRLPAIPTPPPKPTSVALSELAIAAGMAGRNVTLSFDEFPARRYANSGNIVSDTHLPRQPQHLYAG